MARYGGADSGLNGNPPRPIIPGGMPGPFKAGGNDKEAGDGRIDGAFDVGGMDWLLFVSKLGWGERVFTGGTERVEFEFTADVVVAVIIFEPALLVTGTTGGVDDPSLDGIEIDDRDDVDETGDGIAVTPLLDVVFVLDVGASKFDIVGECFLLLVDPLFVPGAWIVGEETIDCLEFGDDTEVDVLVHVVGILLAAVGATEADLPFAMGVVVAGCWPLLCNGPICCGSDGKFELRVSFVT